MSDTLHPDTSFGAWIRQAREARGVSLRQIADATKISRSALEALERNDIARLPGGIFSRAFVRSYAAEIGVDPELAVRDFLAQFPHDSIVTGIEAGDRDVAARIRPRVLMLLGTLAIGVVAVLIWSLTAH